MNKALFLALTALMLAFFSLLGSVNHMDLLTTLSGEFIGSSFGVSVVAMDYNGDGYDDLIVKCRNWNPTGEYNTQMMYGKLYFYWGGPGFDNIPDFVIEGQYNMQFITSGTGAQMINGGDLNGDGIDDLLNPGVNINGEGTYSIYFGRANPLSTPDIVYVIPTLLGSAYPLGDINGDNRDDVALSYGIGVNNYLYVWDNILGDPYLFRTSDSGDCVLVGIGDINNDGLNDCHLCVPIYDYVMGSMRERNVIFFGNENFPQADSLVLSENIHTTHRASPVGDVNNDGFADFVGYNSNLWLGSANLTAIPNLTLIINNSGHYWGNLEYNAGIPVVYGDLNGDGYDDFVGSEHTYNGNMGEAAIWMGGVDINGTIDLFLSAPQIYQNYGFSKTTGDLNGDGLCDLVVSAPYWSLGQPVFTPGEVYVYSGNTALIDTTVDVFDEYISTAINGMELYPNPIFRQQPQFNLKLSGTGFRRSENLSMQMFNIKGQLIGSWELTAEDAQEGVYNIENKGLAAGVYIIKISHGMESPICRKLVIL